MLDRYWSTNLKVSFPLVLKSGWIEMAGIAKLILLLLSSNCFVMVILISSTLFSERVHAAWGTFWDRHQFQVHGFATQGIVKTNRNELFGKSSQALGSLDFREIGLVGSFKPSQKSHVSAQLLSRKVGESNKDIDLDFAIIDYRAVDKMTHNVGFRLGRIKNSFGLFNDTRDMAFTRQNILLPQSIYFERTRDLSLSSDGVELYAQLSRSSHHVGLQFIASFPRVDNGNTERILLQSEKPGMFEGKSSFLSRVVYNGLNDRLTLAYSEVRLNLDYKPDSSEIGFDGNSGFSFQLRIASFQYRFSQFIVTAEYARRSLEYTGMPEAYMPSFLANITGESYYVQLSYILTRKWRIYTRYDTLFQNIDDRYGKTFFNLTGQAPHTRYAKDSLIGVQWNINHNWMLRSELHEVEGVAWLSPNDNENLSETSKFWHAALFSISYRF